MPTPEIPPSWVPPIKEFEVSSKYQKLQLEILVIIFGLISTLVSATNYFLGRTSEKYGPIATLIIALSWILVLLRILARQGEPQLKLNQAYQDSILEKISQSKHSENQHVLAGEANTSGAPTIETSPLVDTLPRSAKRKVSAFQNNFWLSYLMIPWGITFSIWGWGAMTHLQYPKQLLVKGYVVEEKQGEKGYLPIPRAELEFSYGGKSLAKIQTNELGWFSCYLDLSEGNPAASVAISASKYGPAYFHLPLNVDETQREIIYRLIRSNTSESPTKSHVPNK